MTRLSWPRACWLSAALLVCTHANAADLAWARADLLAQDTSRWPEVAVLLQITDLDSYGGDSQSHDTSLPNPLNPFDCTVPDRPVRDCWRVGLKMGTQDVEVLKQTTILDLDKLRIQQLWLVYRAKGEQIAQTPLDLSLSSVMRKGVITAVPLKPGFARLDLQQAPKAEIAESPWPYVLPIAEQRIRAAEQALPASHERDALREQWASFTERDCQFQVTVGIKNAQACRYDHIRAQLQALRPASTRSGT
jgi:hypothetical protein